MSLLHPQLFAHAIDATRLRAPAVHAAQLVLVQGVRSGEAAKLSGIDVAAVSRAVKRVKSSLLEGRDRCPACGARLSTTKEGK